MKWRKRTIALTALLWLVGCQPKTTIPETSVPPKTIEIQVESDHVPFVERIQSAYHSHDVTPVASSDQVTDLTITTQIESPDSYSVPIARDAIAIITHPQSSIDSLTVDQLRTIYRGFTLDSLIVFVRQSDTQLAQRFTTIVMGYQPITPNARIVPDTAAMIEQVQQTKNAIGYIPMSQLTDELTIIPIEGVLPSLDNIESGQYSLTYPLYITAESPPDSTILDFIQWLQTPAGQTAIRPPYARILD